MMASTYWILKSDKMSSLLEIRVYPSLYFVVSKTTRSSIHLAQLPRVHAGKYGQLTFSRYRDKMNLVHCYVLSYIALRVRNSTPCSNHCGYRQCIFRLTLSARATSALCDASCWSLLQSSERHVIVRLSEPRCSYSAGRNESSASR